jgi:hypothetical protein
MRALLAGLLGLLVANNAHAYTYQSAVSKGCHERIATEAIRTLRAAGHVPVVTPSANDRALIHDLPFDLDPDVRDLTGASLAIGARDNDLHGNGPNELDAIAQLHGNPNLQREHCLRGTLQDEPNGTQQAIEDCKQYIREKVTAALEGLDQTGKPDAGRTTKLRVALTFRGHTDVELPVFWIEIGRALHAMADSFTHTYRSADHKHVRVTMNYSDYVNTDFKEDRDGPAHRSEMDECENLDPYRAQNLQLAKQASFEILQLAVDPNLPTREQKLAALESTLHTYLDYEPGCTAANHWCDAPENGYNVDASCAATRGAGRNPWSAIALVAAAAVACGTRRRKRIHRGSGRLFLAVLLAWPATAAADEPEPAPPPGVPTPKEVVAEEKTEKHQASRFALYGAISGSISNPSLNGQLGGRVNLTERWQVGLDGELNNWYGATTKRFATGALNLYGTVVFRTPLRFADFNIRSTANLGTSTLLIDLYGAPSGTTGLFLAIAPAGLEWKLSSRVFLILNGISLALPIPKLTSGAPFAYSQYRATAGVEIAL